MVVTAVETGEGQVIAVHAQEADGAQSVQIVVDVAQHIFVAFAGIAEEFADGQVGETQAQVFEAGDGQ